MNSDILSTIIISISMIILLGGNFIKRKAMIIMTMTNILLIIFLSASISLLDTKVEGEKFKVHTVDGGSFIVVDKKVIPIDKTCNDLSSVKYVRPRKISSLGLVFDMRGRIIKD